MNDNSSTYCYKVTIPDHFKDASIKIIKPNDNTIYYHIDGPKWEPVFDLDKIETGNGDYGKFFGKHLPKTKSEAMNFYALTARNRATHVYEFQFRVAEEREDFNFVEGKIISNGNWQGKFSGPLCEEKFRKILRVIKLEDI